MAKRKTAIDHLANSKLPHIVHVIPPGAPGWREAKGGAMVVSSPAEIDALIRTLRKGELISQELLRAALARRHSVAVACPVSTAIFINMAARAAEERRAMGVPSAELTPWWRVVRKNGLLNPKAPGGIHYQAELLAQEDVRASPLGKSLGVFDFERRFPSDPIEQRG